MFSLIALSPCYPRWIHAAQNCFIICTFANMCYSTTYDGIPACMLLRVV